MQEGVVGVIVTGGTPLDGLGAGGDAALTPFAGRYRFVDFALATLANSGVTLTYVLAPAPVRALAAHLAGTVHARPPRQRPHVLALPAADGRGRTLRVGHALALCRVLAEKHAATAVAVLLADHVLQLDLRLLSAAHRRLEADVTLTALPVPVAEAARRTVLEVEADGRVHDIREPSRGPISVPDRRAFVLSWAGDLVVRASALSRMKPPSGLRAAQALQALVEAGGVTAHDVLDGSRTADCRPAPYWHAPTSVEEYYDAQMELCSARSPLDLHDPAWPIPAAPTRLAPARVVADEIGRPGQTLNTLVSEGAVVRGGMIVNGVLAPGVTIESGAEVEDSVLLEGCRIGRNARVRRAVVAAGAVVEDGAEIGYGTVPVGMQLRPSGLTLVPAAASTPLAVAAAAR